MLINLYWKGKIFKIINPYYNFVSIDKNFQGVNKLQVTEPSALTWCTFRSKTNSALKYFVHLLTFSICVYCHDDGNSIWLFVRRCLPVDSARNKCRGSVTLPWPPQLLPLALNFSPPTLRPRVNSRGRK